MEAGVTVPSSRSSFRKPSHSTSQRNYRRRSPSPSSQSRSRSTSPSHQAALSGGWKRDRSASPASLQRGTNSSVHSKKGRRGHTGNDGSDEDSQGRYGDPGPGVSDRQVGGASYDRYGKPDFQESRRSGSYIHDRDYSSSYRRSYADTRRNGDYEYSGRSRRSPDRGYRDSGRSRDKDRRRSRDRDRYSEGYSKYTSGGRDRDLERETDLEGKTGKDGKERDRDRDRERGKDRDRERDRDYDRPRDRDRGRERSRRRSPGRDSHHDKDDDKDIAERRHERGKSRDSKIDRDGDRYREIVKSKSAVREPSSDREVEAGEIDSGRGVERENNENRVGEKGGAAEKRRSKSGERDVTSPEKLERDDIDCSGDEGSEAQREKHEVKKEIVSGDMDIDTEKGAWERTKDGDKYRDRVSVEDKGGRDLRNIERDKEKDMERSRDKGRGRGRDDRGRGRDDSGSPGRHRDYRDRRRQEDGSESSKVRDRKSKELSTDNRLKNGDEERERSVHREDHRVRDRLHEKEDRSGSRFEKERSGRGSGNSEHISHRDKDRGNARSYGRSSGNDRRMSDATSGKEKVVVKLEKETQPSIKVKEEVDGSSHLETRDGEGGKDREYAKRSQVSGLPAIASDSDTKVIPGLDEKAAKSSKWGPETSDSAVKCSASDELANDLSAAKLAAMKAAELVNKNLGVAGFMSADQKKRLLWGSKKVPIEQESVAIAAGVNRWDTVHFSDPDRQERFQKLMGVKADTCTEPTKEGVSDANAFTEERQRELQQDLEKQFTAGLRRRDGGKVGLGL